VIKGVGDRNAKARHVLVQDLQALRVAIACDDCSPVLYQLCDVTGFSARSGACVKDVFSSLGTQNLTGNRSAWILNVAVAFPDCFGRYQVKFNEFEITRERPGVRIKPEKLFAVDF